MNVVKSKALLPKDFTLCALFNYAVYMRTCVHAYMCTCVHGGEKPRYLQIIFLLIQVLELNPGTPSKESMAIKQNHREPCHYLKSEDGNKLHAMVPTHCYALPKDI